ncbi:MAG: hypothetical protein H5U01_15105, partial [Clostridia bacterium]|nr:hypothetical protein [Clostridia bacterium]
MLLNLVGNAVKFTDHGRIVIGTEAIGGDAGTVAVRFFVEDSGIGMEPALRNSLFEPYVQGSEGRRRGGAGLGLSICRKLVDAMGGRLDVCSTPGQGSRFWFTLVLDKAPPHGDTPAPRPHPSGLRILLAEDDEAHRAMFVATLGAWGHSLQVVGDGMDALARAMTEPFDLLILDIG